MARGVRGSVNYEAQIQILNEKIERYSSLLSKCKSQRQELEAKKQEADMRDLYSYMKENHISATDVIAQLVSPSSAAAAASSSESTPV